MMGKILAKVKFLLEISGLVFLFFMVGCKEQKKEDPVVEPTPSNPTTPNQEKPSQKQQLQLVKDVIEQIEDEKNYVATEIEKNGDETVLIEQNDDILQYEEKIYEKNGGGWIVFAPQTSFLGDEYYTSNWVSDALSGIVNPISVLPTLNLKEENGKVVSEVFGNKFSIVVNAKDEVCLTGLNGIYKDRQAVVTLGTSTLTSPTNVKNTTGQEVGELLSKSNYSIEFYNASKDCTKEVSYTSNAVSVTQNGKTTYFVKEGNKISEIAQVGQDWIKSASTLASLPEKLSATNLTQSNGQVSCTIDGKTYVANQTPSGLEFVDAAGNAIVLSDFDKTTVAVPEAQEERFVWTTNAKGERVYDGEVFAQVLTDWLGKESQFGKGIIEEWTKSAYQRKFIDIKAVDVRADGTIWLLAENEHDDKRFLEAYVIVSQNVKNLLLGHDSNCSTNTFKTVLNMGRAISNLIEYNNKISTKDYTNVTDDGLTEAQANQIAQTALKRAKTTGLHKGNIEEPTTPVPELENMEFVKVLEVYNHTQETLGHHLGSCSANIAIMLVKDSTTGDFSVLELSISCALDKSKDNPRYYNVLNDVENKWVVGSCVIYSTNKEITGSLQNNEAEKSRGISYSSDKNDVIWLGKDLEVERKK